MLRTKKSLHTDWHVYNPYPYLCNAQMDALMKNGLTQRKQRQTGAATRALILKEAERSLVKVGYEQTTVAELAKLLGMSPANIFRHFSSKADLACAVIAGRLTSRSSSASPMGKIGLKGLLTGVLKELIEFSRKEPRLYAVLTDMVSAEDAAVMLRQRMLLELQQAVADIPLPCERSTFLDAIADVFLSVAHPAIVATTAEATLWMRVENVMLVVDLAMTHRQSTKPQAEGVTDDNL
jgi:TetR/AcrR family transcriptional repressor of the ameABC operon